MGALRKAVGERIRALRKEAGLTIEKAASKAAMDPVYWGRVERAEKNITMDTVERMLQALGSEPVELFSVGKTKDKETQELIKSLLPRMSQDSRKQLITLAKHLAGSRK